MGVAPVLIAGNWRPSDHSTVFRATDPAAASELAAFPVSRWAEIGDALHAGVEAFDALAEAGPDRLASFLERFAGRLEAATDALVDIAQVETGLPATPRLRDIELPRTTDQLRQAATAARDRSWVHPTLDPVNRIGSMYAPIPGIVLVFGPNNFPFAFNGIAGGDFAAAIATGHPVLAKANPGHPQTTRLLAEIAALAVADTGLPPAMVQMIYRTTHEDGARMVADPRVAATGYTGGRSSGLTLKAAADTAGKPIYLEMSSVNPTIVLEGAWIERGEAIADDLAASMLLGCGQFCTSPGLVLTTSGAHATGLREVLAARLAARPSGTLLGGSVLDGLLRVRSDWQRAGAEVVAEAPAVGAGISFPNTLMGVDAAAFLARSDTLQQEAFGNMSLLVEAADIDELADVVRCLEGNLTGSIYAARDGGDDAAYRLVEPLLRARVGRLLNDKTPTGVAVVASMNHGGPYPATGHPGFTSVGFPAAMQRFGALQCYDNVPDGRLPPELQSANPLGVQRFVSGEWTRDAINWGPS